MGVDPIKEQEEEFWGSAIPLFDSHVGKKSENGVAVCAGEGPPGVHVHVDHDLDEIGGYVQVVKKGVPEFGAVDAVIRFL